MRFGVADEIEKADAIISRVWRDGAELVCSQREGFTGAKVFIGQANELRPFTRARDVLEITRHEQTKPRKSRVLTYLYQRHGRPTF